MRSKKGEQERGRERERERERGGICSRRLDGQLTVSSNMNERKKKKRRDSLTDQLVRSPSPSRKASLTKRKKGNLWNIYDKLSNIGSGITGYVLRVKERNTGVRFFFYNVFYPFTRRAHTHIA